MRIKEKLLLFLSLAAIAIAGCKSQYDALLTSSDTSAKYKGAFEYFNAGKYQKAASLFESMSVYVTGTPQEDTVLYYWGLSNYRYKDFFTAQANFEKFYTTFPRSPFTKDARFLHLDCLYRQTLRYELDATPTYTCISSINEFLSDYPDDKEYSDECLAMLKDLGDRMDRKAYESAKLYYHIEDYKASRVAFRNVLRDDADNIYREDILYYIAMSSYHFAQMSVADKRKERYLVFIDDYFNFIGEFPDSPYTKELKALYARAQKATGRFTGNDQDIDETSEKDFAKERKAAEKEQKQAEKAAKKEQKALQKEQKALEKAAKKAGLEAAKASGE